MTLKSLLTTTEKTILISNFGIVSRLRCVICILIFSIVILSGLNNCVAQEFIVKIDESQYPNNDKGNIIPQNDGQAVLVWKREPRYGDIVSVDIVPSVVYLSGGISPAHIGSFGWYYYEGQPYEPDTFDIYYTIIDPSNIYTRSSVIPANILSAIQQRLTQKNLGTVTQRQNYISLLHTSIDIQPFDFTFFLSKWILVGISIFLSIPLLWWVIKRFLK